MNIIKYYFGKKNTIKVDKIVSKLRLEAFYGSISKEVHYDDVDTNSNLFSLIKHFSYIKLQYNKMRETYVENLGLTTLNRKEIKYFFNTINNYLISLEELREFKIKQALLDKLNLNEQQFAFLVYNCKDII